MPSRSSTRPWTRLRSAVAASGSCRAIRGDDDPRDRVVELTCAVHARRRGPALGPQPDGPAHVEPPAHAGPLVRDVAPERGRTVATGVVDRADPEHRRQRGDPGAL